MQYIYKFDPELCCWKNVCGLRATSDCSEHCIRYIKMHYLLANSLLPEASWIPKPLFINETDEDYNAFVYLSQVKEHIVEFVNSGKTLYICSSINGNGKSHWAKRLLIAYLSKILVTTDFRPRALFIDVARLIQEMHSNINSPSSYFRFVEKHIGKADLVVWDDFGSSSLSEWELEALFSFINARELNNKANIFTSNKFGQSLENSVGKRIYSRIYNKSTVVCFQGTDKRGEKFE